VVIESSGEGFFLADHLLEKSVAFGGFVSFPATPFNCSCCPLEDAGLGSVSFGGLL
jgi:hypothetical protein